jgi:hypothetical protein
MSRKGPGVGKEAGEAGTQNLPATDGKPAGATPPAEAEFRDACRRYAHLAGRRRG